jgi:hypothetical protein
MVTDKDLKMSKVLTEEDGSRQFLQFNGAWELKQSTPGSRSNSASPAYRGILAPQLLSFRVRVKKEIMAAPSCHTGHANLSHPAPQKYQNVIVLPQTNQLIALLTICRDKNTSRADFIFYANRIIRLLVEEGVFISNSWPLML